MSSDPKLEAARQWIDLALPQLGGRVVFMRQRQAGAVRFNEFPMCCIAFGSDSPISATPYEYLSNDPAPGGPYGSNWYYEDRFLRRARVLNVEIYSNDGEAFDLASSLRLSLRRQDVQKLNRDNLVGFTLLGDSIDESLLRDTAWEETVSVDFNMWYLTSERTGAPEVATVIYSVNGETGQEP